MRLLYLLEYEINYCYVDGECITQYIMLYEVTRVSYVVGRASYSEEEEDEAVAESRGNEQRQGWIRLTQEEESQL